MMNTADRIRIRREELGLTQDELAARMGYKSKSSISKLETGAVPITLKTIKRLAEALETTTAYLMVWTDSVSIGEIADADLPAWTRQNLQPAKDVTRKFDASHAQNADEMELLQGYRAASAPVRKIMLDAARDALKGDSEDSEKSLLSDGEGIA